MRVLSSFSGSLMSLWLFVSKYLYHLCVAVSKALNRIPSVQECDVRPCWYGRARMLNQSHKSWSPKKLKTKPTCYFSELETRNPKLTTITFFNQNSFLFDFIHHKIMIDLIRLTIPLNAFVYSIFLI